MKMNTEKIYETAKRVYDTKIRTGCTTTTHQKHSICFGKIA